ncbi:MAG TPA: hypothetical protein VNL77_20515 [Roseiflexaceae bacterium]|nr:hypothetical protein [Roseiflexaceae bacterium]
MPFIIRTPDAAPVDLWRETLRGDSAARLELLRRIMPGAPTSAAPTRVERAAA